MRFLIREPSSRWNGFHVGLVIVEFDVALHAEVASVETVAPVPVRVEIAIVAVDAG